MTAQSVLARAVDLKQMANGSGLQLWPVMGCWPAIFKPTPAPAFTVSLPASNALQHAMQHHPLSSPPFPAQDPASKRLIIFTERRTPSCKAEADRQSGRHLKSSISDLSLTVSAECAFRPDWTADAAMPAVLSVSVSAEFMLSVLHLACLPAAGLLKPLICQSSQNRSQVLPCSIS